MVDSMRAYIIHRLHFLIDFYNIYLSGKSNTVTDEITPNTDQNLPRGILKNSPDENIIQSVDDIKRKRGLLMIITIRYINEFL